MFWFALQCAEVSLFLVTQCIPQAKWTKEQATARCKQWIMTRHEQFIYTYFIMAEKWKLYGRVSHEYGFCSSSVRCRNEISLCKLTYYGHGQSFMIVTTLSPIQEQPTGGKHGNVRLFKSGRTTTCLKLCCL